MKGAEGQKEILREFLFHGIFGSHKEDFGVLKTLTGRDFKTRKEMGAAFQNRASATTTVTLTLIPMRYLTKLASASQIKEIRQKTKEIIDSSSRCI